MSASRFDILPAPLDGLTIVRRRSIEDGRGSLSRLYCAEELRPAGLRTPIAQINHTLTRKRGTVRGLHFQYPPYGEVKLVGCLRGEVWDVAVDLRRGSPTFLRWHAEILTSENGCSLLIPEGFAHGYQTLTDDCELIYLHTLPYRPDAEGALNVSDPRLAIHWPLPIDEISDRDRAHPFIGEDFAGISS